MTSPSDDVWGRRQAEAAKRKKKKKQGTKKPAPSPSIPQDAEVVPSAKKKAYGAPKQPPQLPIYRPPDIPTVPIAELQQGDALAENINNMTTAFMSRWKSRPTALQASSMLQVAGDRVLSLLEWGRIVDVGLEADPVASLITRNILEYYGATGKLPDPTKASQLIQEDMAGEQQAFAPGQIYIPVGAGKNEIDIFDVTSNRANDRNRAIAEGQKKLWTHRDLSRMPEFAPANLSPEEKADWLRQLANRPMFTLKKRWNSIDEGAMKDAPLINQDDIDKINAAREWYGMTPLYKQIHEPHVTLSSNLFNPDGTANQNAIRALSELTGQSGAGAKDPHTFIGLRTRAAGRKWSELNHEERNDLRLLDEKLASIYPEYKRAKDNRPEWNADFDRWASLYLFEANIGAAIADNPYDKKKSPKAWEAADRTKKVAVANISLATYGQIQPGDDLRMFMQSSGFLGDPKKTTQWSEQFTDYLFQCYLRTGAQYGETVEQSLFKFAAQQNPVNPRSAIPSKYKALYDTIIDDFQFTILAQNDNPLNPFKAIFEEELKLLNFTRENELARRAILGFEEEEPALTKKGGRKTPRPAGPLAPPEINEEGEIVVGKGWTASARGMRKTHEEITVDPDDDFAMWLHYVAFPTIYKSTVGIFNEVSKAYNRFYLTLALLGQYDSGMYAKSSWFTPTAGMYNFVSEKYGTTQMKATQAANAQGITIPLDPRQWTHIGEAWAEAGKRSENVNESPYMRHEFETMGIDPEEHQSLLFWCDVAWQMQVDIAMDAGVRAIARSSATTAAKVLRRINTPMLDARVDAARIRLLSKFETWGRRGEITTKGMTGKTNITLDDITGPSGEILTPDEVITKFEVLAHQAEDMGLDTFQKQVDRQVHKQKVKAMREAGEVGRPEKEISQSTADYFRSKAREIIKDEDFIDYHIATRPVWYDTMAQSLSRINLTPAKVAAILDLTKAHVPESEQALFQQLLGRIGASKDPDEIIAIMNFISRNYLLDLDPGRTWLGRLRHFNRILNNDKYARYTHVIANKERITGGAKYVEEEVYNLGRLSRMGLPVGSDGEATARTWYYIERLWNLDHTLPKNELYHQRQAIWDEMCREIVDNMMKNTRVSKQLKSTLLAFAKAHGFKDPANVINGIKNQWEAFYIFRRIKNSKLLGRTLEPGAITRGAWYDVFQSNRPFLLAGEKGTGQQAYDLIMPFNMHDLVSFQNGKTWFEMWATAPGTGWHYGVPQLAQKTIEKAVGKRIPDWLLFSHGPSFMGVANLGRTFATGSMSFVLSTLMIDEVWRFLVEGMAGRIGISTAGKTAKRLAPNTYREIATDTVESWLEHSADIIPIGPDDPAAPMFYQRWFEKLADDPFWEDFYDWIQTPEVQWLIELDQRQPGVLKAAIRSRLFELAQDPANEGLRMSLTSTRRGFLDYDNPVELAIKQQEWDDTSAFLDWKVNEARMQVKALNDELKDILSKEATVTKQRDLIEELPLEPRQSRHAEKLIEPFRAKAKENANLRAAIDEWDARPNSTSWKRLTKEIKKDFDDRIAVLRRELRDAKSRERGVLKEEAEAYTTTAQGRAEARRGSKQGSPYRWVLLEKDGKFVWTDDARFTHKKPPESGWNVVDQTDGKTRRVTNQTRKWEEYTDEVSEEPVTIPTREMPERGWVAGRKVDDPVYSYEMDNGKIINIDRSVDGSYYEVSMVDPGVGLNTKFEKQYGKIQFKSPQEAMERLSKDNVDIPNVSQKQIDDAREARLAAETTGEFKDVSNLSPKGKPRKLDGPAGALQREGNPDAIENLHEQALGYKNKHGDTVSSRYREDPELGNLTQEQVIEAQKQIYEDSQRALVRDGFPEEFVVYRVGSIDSGIVSVSTKRMVIGGTTDTRAKAYLVRREDVLTYMDGIRLDKDKLAERELHIESSKLRPLEETVDDAPSIDPSDPNYIPPRNVVDVERDISNEEKALSVWNRKKGPTFKQADIAEEIPSRIATIEQLTNISPPLSKAWIANWLVDNGLMTRDRVGPALFPKTWKRGKVLPNETFKNGGNVETFFKNNGLSYDAYLKMRDDWEAERLAELGMTDEVMGKTVLGQDKSIKQIVDEIRARRRITRHQKNMWRSVRREHVKTGRPKDNHISRDGERYLDKLAERFYTTFGDKDLLDVVSGKKRFASTKSILHPPSKYVYLDDLKERLGDRLWPVFGAKENKAGWFNSNGQVGWVPLLSAYAENVPYRMLNGFTNMMRKGAFSGHFNVQYKRLMAIGWKEDAAIEAAAERARSYVARVMYSPGMTAAEKELGKFFYFLPAYRQAAKYWLGVTMKHPFLMYDIRERFKQDFPMTWMGDYGTWVPLPFFLTNGPVESMTPGFTLPILMPLRAANMFSGWENVKVKEGDAESGKDDVYEWRWTGNTERDWLADSPWTNPFTGFASKNVSPVSWLDDLVYAFGFDEDFMTSVEQQGLAGNMLMVGYSIGLALRKDPMARKKAAAQIMQAQISRGYAPDLDAYEMRLKGSPGWYALLLGFASGDGDAHGRIEHPEAVLQVLTRQLLPRKLTYKPADVGRVTSEVYEEPSKNIWISDQLQINGWQLFGDEEARTLADAEYQFYQAAGNESKQKEILERYPKLRMKRNFYKLPAYERAQFLANEENKWLIPYVTGKNAYSSDGFPLTLAEYDLQMGRGAIAMRSNDELLGKINKMYINSAWDKKRWALDKVRDRRIKEANDFIISSIKNDNRLSEKTKLQRIESYKGWVDEFWGEQAPSEYYSGHQVPLGWMNVYAKKRFGKDFLQQQLKWNTWAISVVHDANLYEIGATNPQELPPDIDYSISRLLVGKKPEGAYKDGIEQYYTNEIFRRYAKEFGAGREKRISDAILNLVRPEDRILFNPRKGISSKAYIEKLKKEDDIMRYKIRKIIQTPYYYLNSAAELASALPGIFDPETGIGTEMEMDMWLDTQDVVRSEYEDAITDEHGVQLTYGDKYDAAKKKYDGAMKKLMSMPIAAIFNRGNAGILLYTNLVDPGAGKTWSKVYSDYVVKNILKPNPDYEEMVESLPVAGSYLPEQKLSANAWASICNAAMALREVVDEERRTNPEGGHITDKKNQGHRKLQQYVDAWKDRSDRFVRQWNEWGGDSMIDELLAEAW